ncbi:MAG: ABC transporter substrate-binding protein [Alphaproteobacteria bacterium]|nr:ABC transporter substrate-binding protein [Alphaproteobacteria bacterium]
MVLGDTATLWAPRRWASGVVFCFVAALLAGIVASAPTARAASAEAVFVQGLADNAIRMLSDETKSLEDREATFRQLLQDGFAMEKIGRFVVGRYWRQMSPDQRRDYQRLFSEWIVRSYAARLGGYAGQKFVVDKVKTTKQKDVFVRTRIVQGNSQEIRCDWRIRKLGDALKVIDVVVEGVSMLSTQRSEFTAVISKHGVDGLIEALNTRLSKFPASG